jgi:hypothetical protein
MYLINLGLLPLLPLAAWLAFRAACKSGHKSPQP